MANLNKGKALLPAERTQIRNLISKGLDNATIVNRLRVSESAVKRERAKFNSERNTQSESQ